MTNHLRHRSYWSKELRLFFVDAAALIDVDELRRCATVSLRRWRLRPGTDSVALRPRKIEKCRRISLPAFRDLQSKTCDAVSSDGYQAVPSKPAAKQDDVQPPKEGFSTSAAHVCVLSHVTGLLYRSLERQPRSLACSVQTACLLCIDDIPDLCLVPSCHNVVQKLTRGKLTIEAPETRTSP